MGRTAKVTLTADVRGFKAQVDDAKKALTGLGQIKMSSAGMEKLTKNLGEHLKKVGSDLEAKISKVEDQLANMATSSDAAFDSKKAARLAESLETLKSKYKEINKLQKDLGKGKLPTPGEDSGGEGGGLGGLLKGGMGMFTKMLGFAGVSLGAGAMFNKREKMADERLKMTPLTMDRKSVSEESNLGYTPSERRQTGAEIAQQTQVTSKALSSLTDLSEQLERGYGVSKEQTAGAIGTARRSGVADQGKFVASAVGAAVAAKLEGSKIGEYLSSMTGFMESMSQGINVDSNSLNGFAAAMGTLPFFKNDPSRIFDALRGMSTSFQSNDRFQQAQSARAIIRGAPGASAAAIETRRDMGLFGSVDKETQGNLKKAGMSGADLQALNVTGGQIIQNTFKDIMESTKGMDVSNQNYAFAQRTGMTQGQSMPIYAKMAAAKADGKDIDFEKIAKEIADATADPQKLLSDRMAQLGSTFGNAEGSIKDLASAISRLAERITQDLVDPMVTLAQEMRRLADKMSGKEGGISTDNAADAAVGVIAVGGALTALSSIAGVLTTIGSVGAVAATVMGTLGAGLAALAGVAVGKVLSPLVDKAIGSSTNRQGEKVDPIESAIGLGAAILPGTGYGLKDYARDYMGTKPNDPNAPTSDVKTPGMNIPTSSVANQAGPGPAPSFGASPSGGGLNNVIQFPSGVVSENTDAIQGLTDAIRGAKFGAGGGGPRLPSSANQMNRANTAIGK